MARSSQSGGGKTGSDDLARVIRARRRELGMSRQDLADSTGIPYPTVAQIETAYRGVSPGRLGIIARALGLDPKELYDLLATASAPADPANAELRSPRQQKGSWYANPSYLAADEGAVRFDNRRARPPIEPAGAPRPHAAAADEDAVPFDKRSVRPVAEPAGVAPAAGNAPPPNESDVVDRAVRLLSQLPANERIEALGEVQTQLLAGIVEERVRRSAADD